MRRMIYPLGCLLFLMISLAAPSAVAVNKVLSLDGDGDYVEVFASDSLDITDTITIEAWINFQEGGTANPRIISKGWEANKWGYELVTFTTGSQRPFGGFLGMSSHTCSFGYGSYKTNIWYHLAISYDGTTVTMYINGQFAYSLECPGQIGSNNIALNIGRNSETMSDNYKGYIDEVRIWKIVRTQQEIQDNMDKPLENPESEPNLVGYWNFDGGASDDLSQYGNHGTLYGDAHIADVIYVSTEGSDETGDGTIDNPYRTIQKGINESGRNDIVQALPGTYEENVSLLNDLIVLGSGADNTTLTAPSGNIVTAHNAHNVSISEFTIDGQGSADYGIVCSGTTSEVEISRTVITGATVAGISCLTSADVTIEQNIIRENTGHGIYSDDSANPLIDSNGIESNLRDGIYCVGNSSALITHNHINHNQNNGINCRDTANVEVEYNIIENNQKHDGITLADSSQGYFSHNTVCRNLGMGFRLFGDVIALISDNFIHSNAYSAIWCCCNSDVTIIRNTMSQNLRAVETEGYTSLVLGGSLVDANNITNHPIAIGNHTPKTINATFNYWGTTDKDEIAALMWNGGGGSVDFVPFINTLDEIVADTSGDGTISAYDAALILQYLVGLIDQFPATNPIGQAAQKYIAGDITIDELDRLLQSFGYPSVFKLLGYDNQLLPNYPNPFNPETWIPFKLAQNVPVSISIYDTKGQLIRTITLGNRTAGIYTTKDRAAYWDGRDRFREKVSSGVYFYTLQAGNFTATRRMVILK